MKAQSKVQPLSPAVAALRQQFTLLAVMMAVGFSAADLAGSGIVWSHYAHAQALKARGVDTVGTVVATYRNRRGGDYARYTYAPPRGRILSADGPISAQDAAVLKPGMKVPVAYDLKAPRTSDIDRNGEARSRDVGLLPWVIALVNLVFAGFAAGMAVFIRWAYAAGKARIAEEAEAVSQVSSRVAAMGGAHAA